MLRNTVAPSHRVTYFCKIAANRSAGSEYIVQVLGRGKFLVRAVACKALFFSLRRILTRTGMHSLTWIYYYTQTFLGSHLSSGTSKLLLPETWADV